MVTHTSLLSVCRADAVIVSHTVVESTSDTNFDPDHYMHRASDFENPHGTDLLPYVGTVNEHVLLVGKRLCWQACSPVIRVQI